MNAKNMREAVAQFMASERPFVMTWMVRQGGPSDFARYPSHPVTRERFGHAFDGKCSTSSTNPAATKEK